MSRRFWPLLLLAGLLAGCPAPRAAIDPQGPIQAWATDSLERVRLEDPPRPLEPLTLYAARGEVESFQVVLSGPRGIKSAWLEVSPLRGPGGAVIGPENLTLYRQHYVEVREPSPSLDDQNRSQGAGWYPDALIPFEAPGGRYRAVPVDVSPKQNQPFWVDIAVPRGVPAGTYEGSYRVLSENGSLEGRIRLIVWNFELPLRPSLYSFVPLWRTKTKAARLELLKHRLMPGRVEPQEAIEFAREYGLNSIDLGFWSGANAHTCRAKPAPPVAELAAAKAARQVGVPIYNFTFDELDVCPQNLLPEIRAWTANLRAAGVLHLSTLSPRPELLDDGSGRPLVDIFAINAEMYEEARENGLWEAARSKGSSFWYYTALLNPKTPYAPQWLLDYSPLNWRISTGFLAYNLGFSGILGWAADHYDPDRGQDPWTDVRYFNAGRVYNGDGLWFYPGHVVGWPDRVVPSIRAKWLRDGVEDYEYLRLLRERGLSLRLDGLEQAMARSMRDWQKDPATLEAVRRRMGEVLSQGR
ncbi:hypothetical protein Mlute_00801 [Meiothermus luteus]|uniref:Uncharacterized protein n=1 Tax=Meiothermus luteus TaxID=2026184 RepID=A0A399ETD9_9DEIN|nr:DUF4091 domain-containing protein [Meiothermus luteus]RIH87927.1 hypothetical protein Mlute_00801 [Meiothermus luteus]RMH58924.1 MAG: DUF4091 domain-containing protein [Deinococcota bacterium]